MTKRNYASKMLAPVPQSQPAAPNQIVNDEGGYVFEADMWTRLNRFLILGASDGTFYVNAQSHFERNADAIKACLAADGFRTVDMIEAVSQAGVAPKNDEAIFALVLAASGKFSDVNTSRYALERMPFVCRTATHLFSFVGQLMKFRGTGRSFRRAIGNWYEVLGARSAAYQMVKYRNREGFSHADVLRLAHPETKDVQLNAIYRWSVGGDVNKKRVVTRKVKGEDVKATYPALKNQLPDIILGYEKAKTAKTLDALIGLIDEYSLPREAIPNEWLTKPEIWVALLDGMPYIALMRNLANMTRYGLFSEPKFKGAFDMTIERLRDEGAIKRSRVHPFAIFEALRTYASGKSGRGSNTWRPHPAIEAALNDAFYKAFQNVEPTNKKMLVGIDVSASMGASINGMTNVSCSEAAAVMALIIVNTEPYAQCVSFNTKVGMQNFISPSHRIDSAIQHVRRYTGGGTDVSAPIEFAEQYLKSKKSDESSFEAIIILTDEETWAGHNHPFKDMEQYRKSSKLEDAKLVVMAMEANEFATTNPDDANSLNVAGLNSGAPAIISAFLRGEI